MNRYEGVYFLREVIKEDEIEQAWTDVKGTIDSLGGAVIFEKVDGRRSFPRPLGKEQGGYYAQLLFDLPPEKVVELEARYKLNGNVSRVMIIKSEEGKTEILEPTTELQDSMPHRRDRN